MSESSTMISKFYDPTDSQHKFHKTRLKIGYPQVSNEDLPDWEPTFITTTLYVTAAYEQGGTENPVGESYR